MKKGTKIWLVTAFSLVLVGCIIFGGVMAMLKWDFSKLTTETLEKKEYRISEAYRNISVVTNAADVEFLLSEKDETTVSCYEKQGNTHSVSVKDGTLEIKVEDTRKWYDHIRLQFEMPKITVYLPQGEYGDLSIKATAGDLEMPKGPVFQSVNLELDAGDVDFGASVSNEVKIKATTGDISVKNTSAGSLDFAVTSGDVTVSDVRCEDATIRVTTGDTHLSGITCKSVVSVGNTGEILLDHVVAEEKLSIKRKTGDVKLVSSDAGEIYVETNTGDVSGSLLSEKVFIAKTNTGSVDVPKTSVGGRCEIVTTTGDIKLSIQ